METETSRATTQVRPDPRLQMNTPEVLADKLGISLRKVNYLIQAGEIESVKIGKSRRISDQALLDFIKRHKSKSK